MMIKKYILLSLTATSLLLGAKDDFNITDSKDMIILPYVFSSDSTGVAGGVGIIKQGIFQPQTTFVFTLFYGAEQDILINGKPEQENFSGAFISFSNYKLPYSHRFFFSLIGLKSYFPSSTYNLKDSSTSKPEDAFTTSGESNFLNTTFRYVLPLGEGLDNPDALYTLKNGFAMDREGYGGGTPFLTGRTSLGFKTFYQEDTYENWSDFWPSIDQDNIPYWNTNGLRLFLTHDNTDFDLNPSRGYHFELQYSKDFGKGNSLQSWDFLEFKYNQYFNLDTFSFTQQNVLALSLWTGYSFSWDTDNQIGPDIGIDVSRPPIWEGGRLGGFNRMRGYANNRFTDKAVFYAAAEYRAILDYNPFKENDLIPVAIDWLQVVAFVEAGQVHHTYNADLLSDMKYDVGLSLRAMAAQLPIRVDVGYGDEGVNMWVMIQQPFDF